MIIMNFISNLMNLFNSFWSVFITFDFYTMLLIGVLSFGVVLTIFSFILKGKY